MNIYFDKCADAHKHATLAKSFGLFHSTAKNFNMDIHTHECCEVFFCKKGGKFFLIDDKIYKVHDGDVFIINQFEAHKITFEDSYVERYVIQLHPEFLFSSSTDNSDLSKCFYIRNKNISHCLSLNKEEQIYLTNLLEELKQEHFFGDDVIKNSIMIQLLAFLNKCFLTNHKTEEKIYNEQLKKAIFFINEHLTEDINLEMIAKNSYISVNHLCKLFKSTLGTTVMKYIIGKRISQAKKYLKKGYSVSDTAFICGFHDYSNFIRTFTKSVGVSPGKYKKNN